MIDIQCCNKVLGFWKSAYALKMKTNSCVNNFIFAKFVSGESFQEILEF